MSREPIEPAPRFAIGGEPCESETLHCYAGACVLELATALPDLGVRVETVYVSDSGALTQVSDLFMGPGESMLASRRLTEHPISGPLGRLRCLRDHAECVEAFLASLGYERVGVEIDAGASAPVAR